MILNRMRERFRSQDWFGVGLELLIVVLGVFLGLQASNWNEGRIESETGRSYRERLAGDFRSNQNDLDARGGYYRSVKAHALDTLAELQNPSANAGEQFLIDAYQATQITVRPVKRSAWDEILTVGALNIVGDQKYRETVADYYLLVEASEATFRATTPYRQRMRRLMPYAVQRRILDRCPEVVVGDDRAISRLPEHCTLDLSGAETARAVAILRSDPEVASDLNYLLNDLDQKLRMVQRMGVRLEAVRTETMRGR